MGIPMYRFEKLTKYIPLLDQTEIGNWVIDTENDGTIEHPIQFPFVAYITVMLSIFWRMQKKFPNLLKIQRCSCNCCMIVMLLQLSKKVVDIFTSHIEKRVHPT